jgi:ammonium transporter, Amt family
MDLDSGTTAWMMVSMALVMFMVVGLALFYAGMDRAKNVLGMLMMNFFSLGLISVVWVVVAYSLAFGGDGSGFIGNFDYLGLRDVSNEMDAGVSPLLDMGFQMTFAVITPALIAGAVADRIKFNAWMWFIGLWVVLVYSPVARWVWGGWLDERGALDFAGGTVVHINAGIAALALVLVLGRRKGWPDQPMPPHSLPLTLLGAGILWFGWFGFNAGSAYAADGIAVQAMINTHLAAAAAMLGWLLVEKVRTGHPTTLGAASGVVAGLVAITPCAGFVGGMAPVIIGFLAGGICMFAVSLKYMFGYDDSLDVVGVHFVGGLVGTLLLGFFADAAVNGDVADPGVLMSGGGWSLLGEQALAAGVTIGYAFVVTFVIAAVLNLVIPGGIRVSEEDEDTGLDLTQHSETAYALERV